MTTVTTVIAATTHARAAAGLLTAAALVALGTVPATAAESLPSAPTPERAASAPGTLDTLSRFFASDGAGAGAARTAGVPDAGGTPRVEGPSVPVRILSPDFVAGKAGAPVARVEFRASRAVAPDGRKASLWTVEGADGWQVVNIATGDDEIRYAEQGGRLLPGGLVFREPQIDAWYVQKGAKVLPLDEDAVRAVGKNGTSLTAYRERVARAYGDKLPGSAYARKGAAGGYGPQEARVQAAPAPLAAPGSRTDASGSRTDASGPRTDASGTSAATAAGVGAALALALTAGTAIRRRRAAGSGPAA
ncbi:hypothetical protein ACIGW0_15355 [Streptomyces bikiniensis]|uniref:Uncharacterized protein n=1 Tax=Streptomyces bikiniensis TaxID=1896 RepID=A0ABW8CVA4_STRBI